MTVFSQLVNVVIYDALSMLITAINMSIENLASHARYCSMFQVDKAVPAILNTIEYDCAD